MLNFKKINWEYWPSFMFYVPVVPYAMYLALKSRSFGFFSAVNPAIEGSGNGLESKYDTIQLLPQKYKPKTIFIKAGKNINEISTIITSEKIKYPLIIKPDIGFRGLLVKKIDSNEALCNYLQKYNSINLIVQEFIELKNECGIFYHRIPGEQTGKITSITLKKFLSVIGDGTSTILDLMKNDDRAVLYLDLISEINKDKLKNIPKNNEEVVLNIIGNHSKGTQFIDGNHLISPVLTNLFDSISEDIEGWNYGRIDIKYNSFEELLRGQNFKIIEINGIISEPTHIYDASKGTYFKALKAIKDHWKLIYEIGVKNKKLYNTNYTDLKYFINLYFSFRKYLKKVDSLSTK